MKSAARLAWEARNPGWQQRWEADNKEHLLKYRREYMRRRRLEPKFKFESNMRTRLGQMVSGAVRYSGSLEGLLGCTVAEALAHIESLFRPGMTWDNHGAWHVDHRRPLSRGGSWHYTNLQPLWAEENFAKGASVPEW